MLGELDWDTYWRFEAFRRACDPLDFHRWKRDSQRALRELYPGEGVRLLDSTAGMGDHTVNLAEEGFVVEACDESAVARAETEAAVRAAGLAVPVFEAAWERLAETHAARWDLIFNDALHWTWDEAALRAQLAGFLGALKPGGALVFFFADARMPEEGAGLQLLEEDWGGPEPRVAWSHAKDGRRVTLTVMKERGPDYIDAHHLFHDQRAGGAPTLETLTMREVYRWDWHALSRLLADVGFVDVRSDVFPNRAKGYDFAMNRAFRPR